MNSARLGDRSLFPDLAAKAYLNHAGISPPSQPVRRAAASVLDDYARTGAAAYPTWRDQRLRLKRMFAALIGCLPEDLALVQSTTRGITDVALCFPWKRGDRVVLFEGEFPANVTPWQRAAELFELEVIFLRTADFLESEERGLELLGEALQRGVRVVAVSFVQFQTGLRMPIQRITQACHAAGAEILVDGIQGTGIVPVDVGAWGVDYLACGSHKWLMGIEGSGFLYVRPDRVSALRPAVAGWMSHEDAFDFLFQAGGLLRYDRKIRKAADFIEGGNLNAVGYAALEASIGLLAELGPAAIFDHVTRYLDALEAGLVGLGFTSLRCKETSRRSGILGVLPPSGAPVVALQAELSRLGFSCALPDGVLRFAPHWPNHPGEVPGVISAVEEALATVRLR